jgi:sugar O-acyltransferase (sialic acid O-acetyltransferase NeuD family)
MTPIGIYGAGGFAREVAWIVDQIGGLTSTMRHVVWIVDDGPDEPDFDALPMGVVPKISPAGFLERYPDGRYVIGIGDGDARARIDKAYLGVPISLMAPSVELGHNVTADGGTVICAKSILTTNVVIGKHVHINLACTVGHDVSIGNYATLSPGVHVSGCVEIGEGAFIGTGAVILNGVRDEPLRIGAWSKIGAQACVTRDVPECSTVVGVPARPRGEAIPASGVL